MLLKNFKKTSKKVLTNCEWCGRLLKLSRERVVPQKIFPENVKKLLDNKPLSWYNKIPSPKEGKTTWMGIIGP